MREVSLWRDYTNGYIVSHDVSIYAQGSQANGALGVKDGLIDSGCFKDYELLIIDPHSEEKIEFPYLDPCGLGLGLARGVMKLPVVGNSSIRQLLNSRSILDSIKLQQAEHWFLGSGFKFVPGKIIKAVGEKSWVTCFAPIEPGQVLSFSILVEEANQEPILICAGGNPGTRGVLYGNGLHAGEFICGNENSLIGIYGTENSKFVISDISISIK